MARYLFAGTTDDMVIVRTPGGLMKTIAATLTFWDAPTGGTQHTDLLLDGQPVTDLTIGADGLVPAFEGPDGVDEMWVQVTAAVDQPAARSLLRARGAGADPAGTAQTLIDQLKAGAPGPLDNLDELAQALGDDPAFATTILGLLAGKQDQAALPTDVAALDADPASQLRQQADARHSATYAAKIAEQSRRDIVNATDLRPFRDARATVASGPLNIVVVGDSITEGRSVQVGSRYVDKLLDGLRARWQPGGVAGGPVYIPAFYYGPEPTDAWTYAGSVTHAQQYGIGMRAAHMSSGSGNSMTTTFTGTSFDLFYSGNTNSGTITVTIDGGAPASVVTGNGGATVGGYKWNSGPLAAGSHTVTLTNTSGKTNLIEGIMVYNGDETKGVRLFEGGHNGYQADHYANQGTVLNHAQSVAAAQPDLLMIALGLNDMNAGRTLEQYRTDLTKIVTDMRAAMSGAAQPAILLAGLHPRVDGNNKPEPWGWFRETMRDVAQVQGCSYVDVAARTSGITLTDGVHPDAAGHAMIADALDGFLASV